MFQFNKSQIEELRVYLYHSDIHDAKVKSLKYDREQRTLSIKAINQIYDVEINMVFKEIKVILFISSNEPGCRETIISLTVEEDYSYLQNCTHVCGDCFDDSLYILLQMFSGDELHIISESVLIDNIKKPINC